MTPRGKIRDKWNGDFWCPKDITSLEGAPKEVIDGNFSCNECTSLTTLKGAPKEVGRAF